MHCPPRESRLEAITGGRILTDSQSIQKSRVFQQYRLTTAVRYCKIGLFHGRLRAINRLSA
jgi:hypothetical protein